MNQQSRWRTGCVSCRVETPQPAVTPNPAAYAAGPPQVAVLVVCLGALLWLSPASADWPLFRGNPLQTGVAAAPLPDALAVLWKFQAKDAFEATVAIAGGTVYAGSYDGTLCALDLASGKPKWHYKAGPIKAAPSVKNGSVYVGDEDGLFHCVDAATGKKRWTYETGAEITSSANFDGDRILFGSGDQLLYCLSKEGKELWKFKVPGGPVMGSPALVQGRTFVAGCDSMLHVIDTARGKETGSVDLGGQVGASVAVSGDRLFVGTMANQVLAVNWKKVEVAWTFEDLKRSQPFFGSAAVTDRLVIVGGRDKVVHALDRQTGKPVWAFATRGKVDSSPVVAGQRVYVGSMDGNLYVLDLARGTEVQHLELGRGIAASPALSGNLLVIGTLEGALYCLGKKE
jgi:outer membrane protein assembly factor BamB